LDTPSTDVLADSLTFAILVLFFLAIVRIKNYLYHNRNMSAAITIVIMVIHRTVAIYSNNQRLRWTWIL